MIKYPEQQIHDELFRIIDELGYKVYTYLPRENVPYPFLVIGDTVLLPRPTKSFLIGEVAITLHVWSNMGNRKQVSDIINHLMREFSKIRKINNTRWFMKLSSDSRIMSDNSTNELLYHGIMDLEFKFI